MGILTADTYKTVLQIFKCNGLHFDWLCAKKKTGFCGFWLRKTRNLSTSPCRTFTFKSFTCYWRIRGWAFDFLTFLFLHLPICPGGREAVSFGWHLLKAVLFFSFTLWISFLLPCVHFPACAPPVALCNMLTKMLRQLKDDAIRLYENYNKGAALYLDLQKQLVDIMKSLHIMLWRPWSGELFQSRWLFWKENYRRGRKGG